MKFYLELCYIYMYINFGKTGIFYNTDSPYLPHLIYSGFMSFKMHVIYQQLLHLFLSVTVWEKNLLGFIRVLNAHACDPEIPFLRI